MTIPSQPVDIASQVQENYAADSRLSKAISVWQSKMPDGLLRSAVLPGEAGVAAFRESIEILNMADPRHQQLAPAILKNIGAQAMGDVLSRQSRILYLKNLQINRALLAELEEHLKLFQAAGIPTLCLKGAALLNSCYPDSGIRRILDLDVLVPEARFYQAVNLLQEHGWVAIETDRVLNNTLDTRFLSSLNLSHPQYEFSLDLHAHAHHGVTWTGANEIFWARAVEFRLGAATSCMLRPEDNLSQLLVHGLSENSHPPVRWALDALETLRFAEDFDWQLVVDNARHLDAVAQHFSAISYLREIKEFPGMSDAVLQLTSMPTTPAGLGRWSFRLEPQNSFREAVLYHRLLFLASASREADSAYWGALKAYFRHWNGVNNLLMASILACWKVTSRMFGLKKGPAD